MKDELRRYVNKFPTDILSTLSTFEDASITDFTVPKIGSRVGFTLRDPETSCWTKMRGTVVSVGTVSYTLDYGDGENRTEETYKYEIKCENGVSVSLFAPSVHLERAQLLPNSRWMYFFEDDVLRLYRSGDACTKDTWEDILSELGFIVVEDDTFGLFFGCDGEVSDEVWDTLLDIIKDGMMGCTGDYPDDILICGKCPTRYFIEELEGAIGRDEINRMINEKSTILCPVCATAAGYGHKE